MKNTDTDNSSAGKPILSREKKAVLRTGLVTFCVTGTIPALYTVLVLIVILTPFMSPAGNIYGYDSPLGSIIGLSIGMWILFAFPLTFSNVVAKALSYSERLRRLVFIAPVLAFILTIACTFVSMNVAMMVNNHFFNRGL